MKTKTAGYVARTARNELIFGGFCRERRGEADSGLDLFIEKPFSFLLQNLKSEKNNFGQNCFCGLTGGNNFWILENNF